MICEICLALLTLVLMNCNIVLMTQLGYRTSMRCLPLLIVNWRTRSKLLVLTLSAIKLHVCLGPLFLLFEGLYVVFHEVKLCLELMVFTDQVAVLLYGLLVLVIRRRQFLIEYKHFVVKFFYFGIEFIKLHLLFLNLGLKNLYCAFRALGRLKTCAIQEIYCFYMELGH